MRILNFEVSYISLTDEGSGSVHYFFTEVTGMHDSNDSFIINRTPVPYVPQFNVTIIPLSNFLRHPNRPIFKTEAVGDWTLWEDVFRTIFPLDTVVTFYQIFVGHWDHPMDHYLLMVKVMVLSCFTISLHGHLIWLVEERQILPGCSKVLPSERE